MGSKLDAYASQEEEVPDGWYGCRIVDLNEKPTSMTLTFQIAEGEHKDRKFIKTFFSDHANPKAVEVTRALFGKLLKALPQIEEPEQMIGKMVSAYIIVRTDDYGGNDIRRYLKYTGALQDAAADAVPF